MTQGSLLDIPTPRQKKRGHVPASSVAAYLDVDAQTRRTRVLTGLMAWDSHGMNAPTSAELAAWMDGVETPTTDACLYVRRGLSDLLAIGAVAHDVARACSVSGRTCLTWRVVGR